MEWMHYYCLLASMFIGVSSIWLIRRILLSVEKGKNVKIDEMHIEESRELINVLRTHRHDYLNDLQVIMGYLQLGKSDDALDYIKKTTDSLRADSSISNLAFPEISALLFKKRNIAELKGINFKVGIGTDLKEMGVPVGDVTRILSSMIDQSVDSITQLKGNPVINVVFEEVSDGYSIKLVNSNQVSAGQQGEQPEFRQLREMISKHGGTVQTTVNDQSSAMTIQLPKTLIVQNDCHVG